MTQPAREAGRGNYVYRDLAIRTARTVADSSARSSAGTGSEGLALAIHASADGKKTQLRAEPKVVMEVLIGKAVAEGKTLPAEIDPPYPELAVALGTRDSRSVELALKNLRPEGLIGNGTRPGAILVNRPSDVLRARLPTPADPQQALDFDGEDCAKAMIQSERDIEQHVKRDPAQHVVQHVAEEFFSEDYRTATFSRAQTTAVSRMRPSVGATPVTTLLPRRAIRNLSLRVDLYLLPTPRPLLALGRLTARSRPPHQSPR